MSKKTIRKETKVKINDGKIFGIDMQDYEKLVLSFAIVVLVLVTAYRYIYFGTIIYEMVSLIGLFLTAFVMRKGLSFWKPERYSKMKIEEKTSDHDKLEDKSEEGL
jgi:hypothetical protein